MRKLIVRVVRMVVLLFAVVVALDKFGFQIAPLVAGIGVAGLGIGFALQGVLGNMVAGLTIIFTKPFRVGEYIEIVGVHGDVAAIELFSTTLVHTDRSRIIVPNRKIVGEILHNFGTCASYIWPWSSPMRPISPAPSRSPARSSRRTAGCSTIRLPSSGSRRSRPRGFASA